MADRTGFLARVCDEAVQRVAADASAEPLEQLKRRAADQPPPPGFAQALAGPDGRTATPSDVAVIAEVKRASPSRGHIADIPDPAALAAAYVQGGAAAVSVLTEPAHFKGTLGDLRLVAATVAAPVIRKDFIVDGYQLWQARLAGAAAALLIVAALDETALAGLIAEADLAGLDVLVETHSAAEVQRAVAAHMAAGTSRRLVLGINARDLGTLQVDRGHVSRVREQVDLPDGALLVAESGIRGPDDVRAYVAAGADAVLVGEHVALAADPAAAVATLVAATRDIPMHPQETSP